MRRAAAAAIAGSTVYARSLSAVEKSVSKGMVRWIVGPTPASTRSSYFQFARRYHLEIFFIPRRRKNKPIKVTRQRPRRKEERKIERKKEKLRLNVPDLRSMEPPRFMMKWRNSGTSESFFFLSPCTPFGEAEPFRPRSLLPTRSHEELTWFRVRCCPLAIPIG